MSCPNPWDVVVQTRWQYEKCIGEELRAHETHLANPSDPQYRHKWRCTMNKKSVAFRAYVATVHAAVMSKIPRPADSDEF